MRRPAIVSVGTVALVVAVAAAFHLLVSRGALRDQLEAVLTATFETPVTIGKLETHLLPDAMLTARQITFARRDRSPNLSVAAVHVDVSLSQIWRGELVISDLRLEDVTGGLEGLVHYVGRMSEPTNGESPVQMASATDGPPPNLTAYLASPLSVRPYSRRQSYPTCLYTIYPSTRLVRRSWPAQ